MFRKKTGGGGNTGGNGTGGGSTPKNSNIPSIVENKSLRQSQMKLNEEEENVLVDVVEHPELVDPSIVLPTLGGGMYVKALKVWDLRLGPFKKTMIGGHLVPAVGSAMNFMLKKKRKVSIEIRRPIAIAAAGTHGAGATEADIGAGGRGGGDGGGTGAFELADGDVLFLRMFKRKRRGKPSSPRDGETSDDESVAASESEASEVTFGEGGAAVEWREHRSYKLEDISILKTNGRVVEVKTGSGNDTVVRDMKFETIKDAEKFQKVMDKMLEFERERTKRQIAKYKEEMKLKETKNADKKDPKNATTAMKDDNDNTKLLARGGSGVSSGSTGSGVGAALLDMKDDDVIHVLVEIVSAKNLPIADITSTDPYIIVRMAGKEIHRTSVIDSNLNPIWTLQTGSLFLVKATVEEFFSSSGLTFIIKDFDTLGKNDTLGQVYVTLEDLLNGNGERVGYDIIPEKAFRDKQQQQQQQQKQLAATASSPAKDQKSSSGDNDLTSNKRTLFLRIKKASEEDIKFMKEFEEVKNSKKQGMYAEETFLPFRPPQSAFMKRQTKKGEHNEILHRVKPFPDPKREEQTTWMTKEDIMAESLKPSTEWVEAGSGELGVLYFEVIGCSDLPNMDAMTTNVKDKTDAFACVVFEDSIVMTDVIANTLSPRWMPWSQRAFAFRIGHPSSILQLGVFDFDPELSPLQMMSRAAGDVHDPIGRIQIHLSNFVPNTEYTVAYSLYFGETAEMRQKTRGTVWVRFKMEWLQPRKALLAAVAPPPTNMVSVSRGIDFEVAHYVTEGAVDEKDFNINTLTGYVAELQSYQELIDHIKRAALSLWLWRGHFPCKIGGKDFLLPLHSLTAFIWGLVVTWDFNTFPAFLLFSVGWLLVAVNERINQHPSPWYHCPKYGLAAYYLLVLDKIPDRVNETEILPNQNLEKIEAYEKEIEDRKKRLEREAKLEMEEDEEFRRQMGDEVEDAEAEDVDISTKKGGIFKKVNMNPLKPVLYPVQQNLEQVVIGLRILKSVVLWEESFFAFWIVTASFVGAFILIWIPFGFLFRWISRVVAFCVLGPWMAIVDRYYFKEDPNLTVEEKDELVRKRVRERMRDVRLAATNYQIRKEQALKMQAFKKYMFGKYLLRVPRFSEDLYKDYPLPESFAKPVNLKAEPVQITRRLYGQTLSGDMIPERYIPHTGKVLRQKKRGLLSPLAGNQQDKGAKGDAPAFGIKIPHFGRLRGKHTQEGESNEATPLLKNDS